MKTGEAGFHGEARFQVSLTVLIILSFLDDDSRDRRWNAFGVKQGGKCSETCIMAVRY